MATWVIAGASVANVVVLAVYAYFTWGIWQETRQSAQRTEVLTRQARDAFRLRVLVAYQEEIRWAKEHERTPGYAVGSAWHGIELMEKALPLAFPEEWPEIQRILDQAAEEWQTRKGDQS